jgi:REP element-mobilizing transposase RayT
LGGIARESGFKALAIGGVEDHVHLLLSIPSAISISKAVQLLKGNSSKWIHDTFQKFHDFQWQEGYGAFSIGISGIEDTIQYIAAQREHHRKTTFREELEAFLKKHGMEYATRDLD